ncbi:DNA-directed RNA polymerase subunit A' [Candidatus Pacearchaeota archaeon]|nr:MAG: DNA-directed RNA polymerase subunit A' [Candidatus Pacearchaeota archaeon]
MKLKAIRKQIRALRFNLISPQEIKRISTVKVVTPELYDVDGFPVDGGLMDLRMGAIDPGVKCRTCGKRVKDCPGHPGMIELARPVLHIKFVPLIELALRTFCYNCGKLTLPEEKQKGLAPSERAKKARDAKKCPHCGEELAKIKLEKPTTFFAGKEKLSPIEIRERLVKIPDEELRKIGINPRTARPEWAVLSVLLVPPVTVRPSITLPTGERSEDDLTHKLGDIVRANQRLWENLNAGAPEVIIDDLWELLQYHVTTFFDNKVGKIPPARHRSGQVLKTITERIKGKEGRIRYNLAGKRVNYSARSVVSPDPYLRINEIGVPLEVAKVITVSEAVTSFNIEKMKQLVMNGSNYPGANNVVRPDGRKKRVTEELKEEIIAELAPGYRVERHLQDGDVVLFNRHPTLHKQGLMAHFVKVLPGRTFRLHPGAANPYNADYDGDEMNIHEPQNEEALAEARILLDINNNIISSKNNTNLVGTITDAVTGIYLIGKDEFSRSEAQQLLYSANIAEKVPHKTIAGLELFKLLLPKDWKGNVPSELNADRTFGAEGGAIVKELDKRYGREVAVETLEHAFTLGTFYLSRRGFTMSLRDLNVSKKIKELSEEIIEKAEKEAQKIIEDYHAGRMERLPGKTLEETREVKLLQVLNNVPVEIGEVVKKYFEKESNVNSMIASGSGGNILSVSQMGCAVGQQSLWGKRISFGYKGRTLSFFKKNDLSPKARGFIKSSYFEGLTPSEMFFASITGRDSQMDTALRTPKSGYLHRRLVSAFQDYRVEYDGTVRDASSNIIQFSYGGDGKDVAKLHLSDSKITPGEAIGIVTAQSFGEAATQMVLNVFHHAGVAQMQVTQGLPRLIEILDARKKPSTPSMEIYLDKEHNNEAGAKSVAERIREVTISNLISEIGIDFGNKRLEIKLDPESLKNFKLTPSKVAEELSEKYKPKVDGNAITLNVSQLNFKEIYRLKEKLKKVVVSGVPGITHVLIAKRGKDYVVLTSGSNLKGVMEVKGVDSSRVFTNDLFDIKNVLGIEAARQAIYNEIKNVVETQALDINERHFEFIADAMTQTGTIKGVTRMGIISEKASVLARATFETADKEFINASLTGAEDELKSVVENILLNQPIPVGTGLPGLLVKVTGPLVRQEKQKSN